MDTDSQTTRFQDEPLSLINRNGYITTEDFKEILRELDPEIPESELIGMVNEIDVDDSGTVDFEGL
ncbi:hypothetical protein J6590_098068 [Homalodisca vitripennis]|nr:hypothetical protein J6590_098068 [Homalodisca vitripennis]